MNKKPNEIKIKLEHPVSEGFTIGRIKGEVFFVSGGIAGETVKIKVIKRKRHYAVGVVSGVLEASPFRITPKCEMFGACGGCHYQFMSYNKQVSTKEEVLHDSLKRIAGIEIGSECQILEPITGEEWNYRYRTSLKLGLNGKLGFFEPESQKIVCFDRCYIIHESLQSAITKLNSMGLPSGTGEVIIQTEGNGCNYPLVHIRGFRCSKEKIREVFTLAGIEKLSFENEPEKGRPKIHLSCMGMQYSISSGLFFQAHWKLNEKLVKEVIHQLEMFKPQYIADLYAGAGNFSLPSSTVAKEVIAVEENQISAIDLQNNARKNGIANLKCINAEVEKIDLPEKITLAIVDPPREGLSRVVKEKLCKSKVKEIIYISCNPSTFARDVLHLSDSFKLHSVRIVDMFPQTKHIEILSLMQRKK